MAQTIEMFEVITQSQPHDYQSLEILKEAYSKLGREKDVMSASKRIAQAYVQMGQFSSAILEYETILQRHPEDPDVQQALKEIESKASNVSMQPAMDDSNSNTKQFKTGHAPRKGEKNGASNVEDGRKSLHKVFVADKAITDGDFDLCWQTPDLSAESNGIVEPYDIDIDLARSFPGDVCKRWCILPFDRMSKTVMVATANPFNQQAARALGETTPLRLLWYLAPPADIIKNLNKVFR